MAPLLHRAAITTILTFEDSSTILAKLEMWANAQRDGRPAKYRWRPLFNAADGEYFGPAFPWSSVQHIRPAF